MKFNTLFLVWWPERTHGRKETMVILKHSLLVIASMTFLSFSKISFYSWKNNSNFKRAWYHNPSHPRIYNFLYNSSPAKVISICFSVLPNQLIKIFNSIWPILGSITLIWYLVMWFCIITIYFSNSLSFPQNLLLSKFITHLTFIVKVKKFSLIKFTLTWKSIYV